MRAVLRRACRLFALHGLAGLVWPAGFTPYCSGYCSGVGQIVPGDGGSKQMQAVVLYVTDAQTDSSAGGRRRPVDAYLVRRLHSPHGVGMAHARDVTLLLFVLAEVYQPNMDMHMAR